jgi:hypothetical protein
MSVGCLYTRVPLCGIAEGIWPEGLSSRFKRTQPPKIDSLLSAKASCGTSDFLPDSIGRQERGREILADGNALGWRTGLRLRARMEGGETWGTEFISTSLRRPFSLDVW